MFIYMLLIKTLHLLQASTLQWWHCQVSIHWL